MAQQQKEAVLDVLGWLFLALGILSVFWHTAFGRWQYAVWFCNHAMLIAGIAVLLRSRFWLTAMLNWALIPVSAWAIDFIARLFFGVFVFRITEYMFVDQWWKHLLSLQHLFTVPLMLYALHLLGKPSPRAWLGTGAYGLALWITSYFLITPDYNINCAHEACVPWLALPGYAFVWPLIALATFLATNLFLVWLFSARKAD